MADNVVKFPHSKYWYAKFEIDGKKFQKTTKTTNKRDAEHLAAKWRIEFQREINDLTDKNLTIRSCIELYRSTKPDDRPFKTGLSFLINWLEKNVLPVDESIMTLTSVHLERVLTLRTAEGKKPGGTIIFIGNILRAVKLAKKHGYKVPELTGPDIKNKAERLITFNTDDEKRILKALDPTIDCANLPRYSEKPKHPRRVEMQANYDLFVLLLDTGCRLNECGGLNWNDIDLMKGEIHVYRTKVRNEAILHMSERVKEIMKRRYAEKTSMWVFPNRNGTPKKTFNVLRKHIKRAGLNEATLHTCRHSHASRLIQNGMSLYEVSYILGHSSTQMTQKYAHLAKSDVTKKAAATIDKFNIPKNIDMTINNLQKTYINSYTDLATDTLNLSGDSGSVLESIFK